MLKQPTYHIAKEKTTNVPGIWPDRWVRREGYSGPDLSEKSFQKNSLFIV
jgi:hypothetical protein